jgi:hypothetical protein
MGNRELHIRQLENGPAVLRDLISSIPAERLTHDFGGDIWSVQEHVQHLALTQIMLLKRIQLFFKEEHPQIVPFIPDKNAQRPAPKPIPDLLDLYADWREKQIAAIRKADETLWSKKAVHPEYTHYDFDIAVRHILTHDGFHFYRIEELGLLKAENIRAM